MDCWIAILGPLNLDDSWVIRFGLGDLDWWFGIGTCVAFGVLLFVVGFWGWCGVCCSGVVSFMVVGSYYSGFYFVDLWVVFSCCWVFAVHFVRVSG